MPYKSKEDYKKYWIKYNKTQRSKLNQYHNMYKLENKKIVYNNYGNKCMCCGETNVLFLTIDHVNNDGNKDVDTKGRRISGDNLYRKIIKECFPDKYQILCYNCNTGKYRNKGICPHESEVLD